MSDVAWERQGTVSVEGVEIGYRIAGAGEPLVLLHNFMCSSEMWTSRAAPFVDRYRLVAVDLPGHGTSDGRAGRWTHRAAAVDVLGVLDRLGFDRVAAIGASSGGMTLLHAAASAPERVRAMVLVGATTHFGPPAKTFMAATAPGDPTWAPFRQFHRSDEQFLELQRQFHSFKDDEDDMAFTPERLASIAAQTLIVHGDRDQLFPIDIAVEMYRWIPNSYLWILPNGTHTPLFDGHTDSINEKSLEFLDGSWALTI